MAKLGTQASASSQSGSQAESVSQQPDGGAPPRSTSSTPPARESAPQRPQINISSTPLQSQPSRTSSSRSDVKQNDDAPRIRIGPSPSNPPPSSRTESPRSTPRANETIEDFEDRTLSGIFKITLNQNRLADIHGQKLNYLPNVRQELEDQGQQVRMSIGVLEQALLEAASDTSHHKPLHYLLPCWKRVSRFFKGFRKQTMEDPKFVIVSEARRLCMSYCIFAATMPEMFG